jgi:hypothetical protein
MKCRASREMKFFLILTTIIFFNISCNKNIDTGANKAYLAVTNISPDAQPLDIFFEGDQLNSSGQLPYDSTTGVPGDPYLVAVAGVHNFKLSSGTVSYVDGNIAMQRDHYYSLFAYDSVANNNNTLKTLILQDVLTAPNDTLSSIRFLNFTDTAFYVVLENETDTVPALLIRNVVANSSPSSFTFSTIKSGTYNFSIVKNPTMVFDLGTLSVDGTKIYTVYIQGSTVSPDPDPLTERIIRHN